MTDKRPPPLLLQPRDWAELVLLSVIWGASYIFIKLAVGETPRLFLAFSRVAIGAAALGLVLAALRMSLPRGLGAWRALAIMGLLNNALPFALIITGQSLLPSDISASLAAILNATTPLFTVVVAHLMTDDEKLTAPRLGGVLLGFSGVALMLGPALAGRAFGGDSLGLGAACCLAAAVSYALSGVYGRRVKALGLQPLQGAFGQLATSTLMLGAATLLVDRPWTMAMPHAPALAGILGLGLLSTGFAYILFYRILASAGATNLLLVTFLIPVTAVGVGVAFFGERIGWTHAAGMALIAAGLAAIDGRPFAWLRRRTGAAA